MTKRRREITGVTKHWGWGGGFKFNNLRGIKFVNLVFCQMLTPKSIVKRIDVSYEEKIHTK